MPVECFWPLLLGPASTVGFFILDSQQSDCVEYRQPIEGKNERGSERETWWRIVLSHHVLSGCRMLSQHGSRIARGTFMVSIIPCPSPGHSSSRRHDERVAGCFQENAVQP